MLDTLLHGQEAQSSQLEQDGVEVLKGDLRDPDARARALEGVDEVVNLAAIVGDPACARDPELSEEVNVKAARALAAQAQEAGVGPEDGVFRDVGFELEGFFVGSGFGLGDCFLND